MTPRATIIAGNWKMNLVRAEARSFCAALRTHYTEVKSRSARAAWATDGHGRDPLVILFPSAPLIAGVADALRDTPVAVGAQDLHPQDSGAHTGDVSGRQLRSAGASWVLCGHSERRGDHHESDALVAAKVRAALAAHLRPIVCMGETLEQRESDQTAEVLARQLGAVTAALATSVPQASAPGSHREPRFALAYEPIWAIGTGRTATPQIAQDAHAFLRRRLAEDLGQTTADEAPLLYGGSAKPGNCESLIRQIDVDGLLIGGASLDSADFLDMIRCCGHRPPGGESS